MVWGFPCYCCHYLFASNQLCVPWHFLLHSIDLKCALLHLNFYFRSSEGEFCNSCSFTGIYTQDYSISEFPRKINGLAHAVFPLGVPLAVNEVTTAAWNKFLCILLCKTMSSYDSSHSLTLLSGTPSEWNSTTSLCNTDITLLESFYFQNISFFLPQIRSWLLCVPLMELLIIFL